VVVDQFSGGGQPAPQLSTRCTNQRLGLRLELRNELSKLRPGIGPRRLCSRGGASRPRNLLVKKPCSGVIQAGKTCESLRRSRRPINAPLTASGFVGRELGGHLGEDVEPFVKHVVGQKDRWPRSGSFDEVPREISRRPKAQRGDRDADRVAARLG